jgi:hypothetical protein
MALTATVRGSNSSATTTVAVGPFTATGGGALLAVAGFYNSTTVTLTSITRTGAATEAFTTSAVNRNTGEGFATWGAYRLPTVTAGTATVTATFNTAATFAILFVIEVTAFVGTPTFETYTASIDAGSVSIVDPGSAALVNQNCVILEGSIVTGSNGTGTGWTTAGNLGGNEGQYKVVTTGTWGTSAFNTATNFWAAHAVAVGDAAAAGGQPAGRRVAKPTLGLSPWALRRM